MITENNVAAQAGDEPMLPHHPEPHTHTWSALEAEAIRKYGAACRAAGAAQVSPRATADVERYSIDEICQASVKAGLGILECNSLIVTLKGA